MPGSSLHSLMSVKQAKDVQKDFFISWQDHSQLKLKYVHFCNVLKFHGRKGSFYMPTEKNIPTINCHWSKNLQKRNTRLKNKNNFATSLIRKSYNFISIIWNCMTLSRPHPQSLQWLGVLVHTYTSILGYIELEPWQTMWAFISFETFLGISAPFVMNTMQ